MTAPKFTPGPWDARRSRVEVKGKGILAAVANPWDDEAEREANARLIAAAPELYALLEDALTLFAYGVGAMTDNGDKDNQERCVREAGELNKRIAVALAKARGNQPNHHRDGGGNASCGNPPPSNS